jgi:PhoH-like ATPase
VLGIRAEDFQNDQVLDDIDLLYPGIKALPEDFWTTHGGTMESWMESQGRSFYRIKGPLVREWTVNEFLYMDDDSGFEVIVRERDREMAVLQAVRDYRARNMRSGGYRRGISNRISL